MAIEINLSTTGESNGNLSSSSYKGSGTIPATQSNVVETVNAYNEQLKKHYYDKTETRADENALQTSIMNIVQQLDKSTLFNNETKNADETTDIVESLGSVTDFNQDLTLNRTFNVAGLIQKINIIANIISGTTEESYQNWDVDKIGNNVGKDSTSLYVPVIGLTREDAQYSCSITQDSDGQKLEINGLKKSNEVDVSNKTVLSEKQVSDMIKVAVASVLGSYDSQIGALIGYLIWSEDVPEAFKTVLGNTKNPHIYNAPLYIKGYDTSNDSYEIVDLNGEALGNGNLTKDYTFNGSEIRDNLGYWIISAAPDYSVLNVRSIDNVISYNIPIPSYSVEFDFGHCDANNLKQIVKELKIFNNISITLNEDNNSSYDSYGKGVVKLPLGSKPVFNLPDSSISVLNNDCFKKDEADGTISIKSRQETDTNYFIHENTKIGCNYAVATLYKNNGTTETCNGGAYEGNTLEISISSVSFTGHTVSGTSMNGTVSSDKKKVTYTNVTDSFEDTLIWEPNKYTITYSGESVNLQSEQYDYGSTITLPTPEREGYEFDYWSEN